MSSSTILGTVEGFVRRHVEDVPDWDTIVKICDECQGAADRTHSVINALLENLKDPKSTPERLYNSLILLDALVKNVSYSRIVVATKDVCKIMEKIAKLQEKADLAKKIAKSTSKAKPSSSFSLIYSISSSSSDFEKWSPDDKAMRMIQSWGMLHPAEFPLYLKSVEKWKKAGVVFPAADPEDLVPLPKALSNFTSMKTPEKSTSSHSTLHGVSSASKSTLSSKHGGNSGGGNSGVSGSGSRNLSKAKFVVASERIINAANNSSSLLLDMCTNIGEDGFCVDADIIDSCVMQCKEFSPKLGAFIEALLGESSVVMEIPEAKREEILNSLLYSKDQIDSAIKLAEDIKKGNYDTNPLDRVVKVYDPAPQKTEPKKEKHTSKKTPPPPPPQQQASSSSSTNDQLIDFFGTSTPTTTTTTTPAANTSSNVAPLDFFGNQNSANSNDNFDFFAPQPNSSSSSSVSQFPPPPPPPSSSSSAASSYQSSGNSFLDQLLGEYSAPAPAPAQTQVPMQPQNSNANDNFDFFKV